MGFFKVKNKRSLLSLLIIIILTEAVGVLGGYLGVFNTEAYNSLIKPAFVPPIWAFALTWLILYLLMAFAAYRIWMMGKQGEDIRMAVKLYVFQLVLNFIWTIIFFRFRLVGLAFIELMLLLIFIMITTFEFFRVNKFAGFLMIPYILLVSFAGVINFAFWSLNNM